MYSLINTDVLTCGPAVFDCSCSPLGRIDSQQPNKQGQWTADKRVFSLPAVSTTMTKPVRKGAQRRADVTPEIRGQLNRGEIETASLSEWLVIDQTELLGHVLPAVGLEKTLADVRTAITSLKTPTTMKVLYCVGEQLATKVAPQTGARSAFQKLARHPSDCVRSWAAMIVGYAELPLAERLTAILPFAADAHFGVREVAWLAVRNSIAQGLDDAIDHLADWTSHADANVRRFASEVTRPRGVWCKHIDALKAEPEQGLPILYPLRSDPAKYVRDSVANWLNDAGKTKPAWVRGLCRDWLRESPTKETSYIARRAQRNL